MGIGGSFMILGIYGYHKSGKTLFLENLMDEIKVRGYRAAAIKHLGEDFREDLSGDTGRLARAGYDPIVAISNEMFTIRMSGYHDLSKVISMVEFLSDPDVIFIEGFKHARIKKIAVGDIRELPGTVMRISSVLSNEFDQVVKFIIDQIKESKDEKVRKALEEGVPENLGDSETGE